jgi:predicted peroxiredoxin
MATFLIHIHTGPENPTKAALGFLVAAAALKEGHQVSLFLAGDAVLLLHPDTLATLEGKGTGRLQAHHEAIAAAGGRYFLSGMSSKARGLDAGHLDGQPAEFALPDVLVRLAAEADKVLTY